MTTARVSTSALALFCDSCGLRLPGYLFTTRAWPLVWALASDREWAGRPHLPGPHFCGPCTATADNHGRLPGHELHATIRQARRATVALLTGDLDAGGVDRLHALLAPASRRTGTLVLDLAGVSRVDSTALAIVAAAVERYHTAGGRLVLARPSRYLRTVLNALHPDLPAPVDDPAAAAVTNLSSQN